MEVFLIYTSNDIVTFVKRKLDIYELNIDYVSKSFLNSMILNVWATNFLLNKDNFKFKIYKIERNKKSEKYFSVELTDFSPLNFPEKYDEEEVLLLVLEETYGYYYTNNSYLHTEISLDIMIKQGIDMENSFEVNQFNFFKSYIKEKDQLKG